MKNFIWVLLACLLCTVSVRAAELPQELREALPQGAEELLEHLDTSGSNALSDGVSRILENAAGKVRAVFKERLHSAVSILLVVILCGIIDSVSKATGSTVSAKALTMAGALLVTLLTVGSLDTLMGLGTRTIEDLSQFSKVLLPTLAAAAAAGGAVGSATLQQVATVFFADLLMNLINGFLMPMVYLYAGMLTAGAILPDGRMSGIAAALKKVITWILSGSLILFTLYLSVVHIVSGAADSLAVKVAKTAISGVVPVVGSIISEASETVLLGAGMLKNSIGVFGMLAILATCAYPFLQLGIQYLLYKLTAFLAEIVGAGDLGKLINGLGGAFGVVLGMTGACAILLLISILASIAAVIP